MTTVAVDVGCQVEVGNQMAVEKVEHQVAVKKVGNQVAVEKVDHQVMEDVGYLVVIEVEDVGHLYAHQTLVNHHHCHQ